jgi:hypothetical protein
MADIGTFTSGDVFDDNITTRPVLTLTLLAMTVLLLATACIVLPLLLGRRSGRDMPPPGSRRWPFYTFFAGIGLGFLLVEIAQLQRLSIFLGHPTYALGVVLFSVLLFSGIGSMISERIVDPERERTMLPPLFVLLGVVLVLGIVTPLVISAVDGATTPVRVATAVALLMPAGLMMGMPFSIGMRAAAARPGTPTAFLWGINGATSVCASVLAVVTALFFGISMAYWAGLVAYGLAALSLVAIVRTRQESPVPAEAVSPTQDPTGAPVTVG